MKFYTSYYAKYKDIPKDFMCVGISRMCPFKDWNHDNLMPNFYFCKNNSFAPSEDLLTGYKSGKYTEQDYKRIYATQIFEWLKNINMSVREWADQLADIFEDYKAVVFMCYETPDKFCHRHVLRKFMNLQGVECEEYGVDKREVYGYNPGNTGESVKLF